MLAGEEGAEIYRGSDHVDRLLTSHLFRRRRGSSLPRVRAAKVLESLRLALVMGRGYDLVIHFWWGSRLLRWLGWWAGTGRRVGFAPQPTRLLTTCLGPFDFRDDDVSQHRRLLAAAGVETGPALAPEIHTTADEVAAARELLARRGVPGPRLVVLHPGSDWACQQWRQERWAELGDRLAAAGAALVFTGSAHEARRIDSIRAAMQAPAVSLAGATTVRELGAVLTLAQLCVCVDSGAHVVARAVGVPTVVLAGPTTPQGAGALNRTGDELRSAIVACKEPKYPAGGCQNHACPMAGLRSIQVEDVVAAIEETGLIASHWAIA